MSLLQRAQQRAREHSVTALERQLCLDTRPGGTKQASTALDIDTIKVLAQLLGHCPGRLLRTLPQEGRGGTGCVAGVDDYDLTPFWRIFGENARDLTDR